MTPFQIFDATLLPHPRRPRTTVVAEFALPTGSFKDRGAAAVVADAVSRGARRVSLDSSGNSGLAVAAAAARAGLESVIRVTTGIAPLKEALIRATGATLEKFSSRTEAVRACSKDRESYDASHVRNPVFRRGVSTLAAVWQAHEPLPRTIYLPIGNGSLLLGLWRGVRELHASGALGYLPCLIAVQSERCAPIARPADPGDGKTMADGCAILAPPAAREIRAAIEESGGRAVAVTEDEIDRAWRDAWRCGFPIEPTSALAFAGLEREFPAGNETSAVIATGSGLKAPPISRDSPAI